MRSSATCHTSVSGCKSCSQLAFIEANNHVVPDHGHWHRAITERQQLVVGRIVFIDEPLGERLSGA